MNRLLFSVLALLRGRGRAAKSAAPDASRKGSEEAALPRDRQEVDHLAAVLHRGPRGEGADDVRGPQAAFVEVNEKGTEAAAATGVKMGLKSIIPPRVIFRADHPFIFALRDNRTGAVLFLGRVVDPQ